MKKLVTDIKNNIYLNVEKVKLKNINKYIENNVIVVYKDEVINKWLGMGSAITETSGYNYFKLDDEKKNNLIHDLYSSEGLNLNLARLPIGSCDFSLKSYQYSNKKDLSDFSIDKDKEYIIPMLNDIYNYKKITLISSPWSPPSFMKNNKIRLLGGKLNTKYYDLYAKYLHNYIDEYQKLGFDINYITMQNEPMALMLWESCKFDIDMQRDFIENHLIKELENTNTNIILWDHNRENIYNNLNKLYIDNEKVKGIGFHWYSGRFYNNLRLIHKNYPNMLLFNTEMCCGYSKYDVNDWIGDAEGYLKDIISCMNSGINAYLDWNVLLNYKGGPSHIKNPVKSPIILNKEENNYIKTPIYYYLMHISKYIKEGYEIIESDKYDEDLYVVAAKNENELVITIMNTKNEEIKYNLLIDNKYISDKISSHSIITYVI